MDWVKTRGNKVQLVGNRRGLGIGGRGAISRGVMASGGYVYHFNMCIWHGTIIPR